MTPVSPAPTRASTGCGEWDAVGSSTLRKGYGTLVQSGFLHWRTRCSYGFKTRPTKCTISTRSATDCPTQSNTSIDARSAYPALIWTSSKRPIAWHTASESTANPRAHANERLCSTSHMSPISGIGRRMQEGKSMTDFLTDVTTLRQRAREHIEEGPITAAYGADRQRVI